MPRTLTKIGASCVCRKVYHSHVVEICDIQKAEMALLSLGYVSIFIEHSVVTETPKRCYFCNILLIFYILAPQLPYSGALFIAMWGLVNGPVLTAITAWGNSLVFHSVGFLFFAALQSFT